MPSKKRHKTKYAGVYYINSNSGQTKKSEKIYYVMYRKNGKLVEEKVGRQYEDDMSPSRASGIRAEKIQGKLLPNREHREEQHNYN